jgi:antitoxin YefM
MEKVSYNQFRKSLDYHMERVCDDGEPRLIVRRNARSVVLISAEDYDGLVETVHLLKSPANATRLLRSIAEADGVAARSKRN